MSTASAVFNFLPWVRQGFSVAGLPQDDTGSALSAVVTLTLEAQIAQSDPIRKDVRLYGPGDITGIDARQIVRTDPQPFSTKFESNIFASIEFDRPDVPWMFTPASANAQGRLRPWLCLVVVQRTPGVSVTTDNSRPMSVLKIEPPANPVTELIDLAESWAWAHGQIAGQIDNLTTIVNERPERTVSRLICPRRLQPGTAYFACVVPTFDVGRKAGLGLPIDPSELTALNAAWKINDPHLTALQLPVYYYWQFETGPEGDFRSLVRLLTARRAPDGLGLRDLDVTAAGRGLPQIPPSSPDAILGLEGALTGVNPVLRGFTNGYGTAFRAGLRTLLEPAATAAADPVVTAPVYGSSYTGLPRAPADNTAPHWYRELNLDPRYRVVAGIGTAIIQRDQESLMAAAWDQVGDIERANRMLRNAQLVRSGSEGIHRKHLQKLAQGTLIEMSRAVHGRILLQPGNTVDRVMSISNTPTSTASPTMRRVARPRGPIYRKVLPDTQLTVRPIVQEMAFGHLGMGWFREPGPFANFQDVEAIYKTSGGIRSPFQVPVSFGNLYMVVIADIPPRNTFIIRPPDLPGMQVPPEPPPNTVPVDSPMAARFREAITAHRRLLAPPDIVDGPPPFLDMLLSTAVLNALTPETARAKAVQPLISVGGQAYTDNDLEPVSMAPTFPRPMYEAVRDMSPELLLPGLDRIVENTVMLLEPNVRFIESLMAGLNHEFGRELLWRGFPASLRGTYFRQFWEPLPKQDGTLPKDVPPITEWPAANHLGDTAGAGGKPLVLLIRGELLRRYPNAIIRAIKAVIPGGQTKPAPGTEELAPLFYASIKPDLSFFGFKLTKEDALGLGTAASPGWFFVIQEHPTEPRFGVAAGSTTPVTPGATSSATAVQFLRRPVRIAIHARDLLKEAGQ
jgi:hypothetical protein